MSAAARIERAWRGTRPGDRLLRAALTPAAWAYGAAVRLRNAGWDLGVWTPARVPATVISVGNLTVGGSGKTPTALWLAERLAARGRRVALVARGYRKTRPGVVVVSAGAGPLVGPAEGGDEAAMLARRFAGPVVTGERRADAAAHACAAFGVDTVVLDDGFQHRALARDADLVCWADDAGARRLLPAGSLREPLAGLRRARALLVLGAAAPPRLAGVRLWFGQVAPVALVRAGAAGWETAPLDGLRGADVVAVCGVARPERVVATLQGLGARVVRTLAWPDHHAYGAADVAAIAAAGASGRLVTTEKDLVKLDGTPLADRLVAVRVGLEVRDGEALVDSLLAGSVSGIAAG